MESAEFINNFKSSIINDLTQKTHYQKFDFNIIITVGKKGALIFDDLFNNLVPCDVLKIISYDISLYENEFEDSNVLLFDDSIDSGETIKSVIDILQKYNIRSLSILTIAAVDDICNEISKEYDFPINFTPYLCFNNNHDFASFCGNYLFKYFDYLLSNVTITSFLNNIGSDADPFGNPLSEYLTNLELSYFRNILLGHFRDIYSLFSKFDFIIRVDRKGSLIFDDLLKGYSIPDGIKVIYDFEISDLEEELQGKNILLFDDSIFKGFTISKIIDKLSKCEVKSILAVSILANEITYNRLKDDYKDNTLFHIFIKFETEDLCTKFYYKCFPTYFDFICRPFRGNSIIDVISYNERLYPNDIGPFFGLNECEFEINSIFLKYENNFRINFELYNNETVNEAIIMSNINLSIGDSEIKFYVHLSDFGSKIYIEYILDPDIYYRFSGLKNKSEYNLCDDNCQGFSGTKRCFQCLTASVINIIRNVLKANLRKNGIALEFEELPWILERKNY